MIANTARPFLFLNPKKNGQFSARLKSITEVIIVITSKEVNSEYSANTKSEKRGELIQTESIMARYDELSNWAFCEEQNCFYFYNEAANVWELKNIKTAYPAQLIKVFNKALKNDNGDVALSRLNACLYHFRTCCALGNSIMGKYCESGTGKIPLLNGVYCTASKSLEAHKKTNYLDHVFNVTFNPNHDTKKAYSLIRNLVSSDSEASVLIAVIRALLFGLSNEVQSFIELYGNAGTGKSTFIKVIAEMLGDSKVHPTNFEKLESAGDKFLLGFIENKLLVWVSESGHHYGGYNGSVSMLKTLSSHSLMSCEKKGGQAVSGRFKGLLITDTNSRMDSSDVGLDRRRVSIPFENVIDKANYKPESTIMAEWLNESPGIFNLCCQMTDDKMREIFNNPKDFIPSLTEVLSIAANNDNGMSFINDCVEFIEHTTKRKLNFVSANEVYSQYCNWCESSNVKPDTAPKFNKTFLDKLKRAYKTQYPNGKESPDKGHRDSDKYKPLNGVATYYVGVAFSCDNSGRDFIDSSYDGNSINNINDTTIHPKEKPVTNATAAYSGSPDNIDNDGNSFNGNSFICNSSSDDFDISEQVKAYTLANFDSDGNILVCNSSSDNFDISKQVKAYTLAAVKKVENTAALLMNVLIESDKFLLSISEPVGTDKQYLIEKTGISEQLIDSTLKDLLAANKIQSFITDEQIYFSAIV